MKLITLNNELLRIEDDPVLNGCLVFLWGASDIGFVFSPDAEKEITYVYGTSYAFKKDANPADTKGFFDYVKSHLWDGFIANPSDSFEDRVAWHKKTIPEMYSDFDDACKKAGIETHDLYRYSKIIPTS